MGRVFVRGKNNFVGAEILPRVSGRSFILVGASVRESIIDNYARCPLTLIGTLFRCNDAADRSSATAIAAADSVVVSSRWPVSSRGFWVVLTCF